MMLLLLFFSFAILESVCCTDSKSNDEKRISNIEKVKKKIFENYDKDVRPGMHYNDTTTVYFGIMPFNLIDLDEEKSLFTLDSFFIMHWMDERLKWNASEYDGLDHISVPDNYVWQPDIRIYNAHNSNVDPTKDVHLSIFPGGTIWWYPPATVTSYCDVTTPAGSYPYDKHQCNLTVGMWTHDGWQIDIKLGDYTMYWDFFSNTSARWEVLVPECGIVRKVAKYDCCEEPYPSVVVTFSLRRRIPIHLQIVKVACILVMVLALSMFWIPSYSENKITLASYLLVVLTAMTIYCAAMTNSPNTPLVAVSFVQATMAAVASAAILEIVVITIGQFCGPRRPPEFLVGLLSGKTGDFLFTNVPWKQSVAEGKVPIHEDSEPVSVQPTPNQEWLLIATGFDRVLFLVYIVVFAAIHQV